MLFYFLLWREKIGEILWNTIGKKMKHRKKNEITNITSKEKAININPHVTLGGHVF